MKVSKFCLLAVIFYLLGGINLSAQTTKAGLMEKTVIDFYRTNYGNARYGLAPRSGSALGRLSGKEYVSHARSRPFYRCEDFDELKNFSAKAVS